MSKKKSSPVQGLPCIHIRVPKRGKEIYAEIIDPTNKKIVWTKKYPKGTDVESIISEARCFKPKPKPVDIEPMPFRFPIMPQKMVA